MISSALALVILARRCGVGGDPPRSRSRLILADDLGREGLRVHGREANQTRTWTSSPSRATSTRTTSTGCSPTRAAFRPPLPDAGRASSGSCRKWARYGLPLDERTLADAIKERGWPATARSAPRHFAPEYSHETRVRRQYGHYNGASTNSPHPTRGPTDRTTRPARRGSERTSSRRRLRSSSRTPPGRSRYSVVPSTRPLTHQFRRSTCKQLPMKGERLSTPGCSPRWTRQSAIVAASRRPGSRQHDGRVQHDNAANRRRARKGKYPGGKGRCTRVGASPRSPPSRAASRPQHVTEHCKRGIGTRHC